MIHRGKWVKDRVRGGSFINTVELKREMSLLTSAATEGVGLLDGMLFADTLRGC